MNKFGKKNGTRGGFISTLLVIIIAAAIGGIIYIGTKSPKASMDTSGWKTLVVEDSGFKKFEIQYPAESQPRGVLDSGLLEVPLTDKKEPNLEKELYITKSNISEEQCANTYFDAMGGEKIQKGSSTINGADFEKATWESGQDGKEICYYQSYKTYNKESKTCLAFTFGIKTDKPISESKLKLESSIFNEMLLTLKSFKAQAL